MSSAFIRDRSSWVVLLAVLSLARVPALSGQAWNSPDAMELVHRGIERRLRTQGDSGLKNYTALAHGFVFFLAQLGEGLAERPRLVKADELDVEVYWRPPDISKQIILGWRDGRFLPTDIQYHRDHLGIVTNNFGNVIRIGEGDEVRDALHPLAPGGPVHYDYALGDSVTLRSEGRDLVLHQLQVRPRSYQEPLVIGAMYLDAETAELVRFRFSFTPAAYLDPQVEDISVVLENALFEGRFWLPYQQEIEIRRRYSWLDFPARGIIRGRWEIGNYTFNAATPPPALRGPAIGGLLEPSDTGYTWPDSLGAAIAEAVGPINRADMGELRAEVERIAGARSLSGLPVLRVGGSVSELVLVNRVQGLTLGSGANLAVRHRRLEVRPYLAYGTSDGRFTGGLSLERSSASTEITVAAARSIRDFSDIPVISGLLNSFTSQEAGNDHGDYVLLDTAAVGLRQRIADRTSLNVGATVQTSGSLGVAATPATGQYQANPPLGAGTYWIGRLSVVRDVGGIARKQDLSGAVTVEAGWGPGSLSYTRAAVQGRWLTGLGSGQLLTRGYVGWGSTDLPTYRSFVLGGRGTLLGVPYRAYGGREMAFAHVEWRLPVPVPHLGLGPFVSTGRTAILAPYVAAGWSSRSIAGTPWVASDGVQPVVGLAVELLMRLIRVDAGVALRTGGFGITVDVTRDWWGIL